MLTQLKQIESGLQMKEDIEWLKNALKNLPVPKDGKDGKDAVVSFFKKEDANTLVTTGEAPASKVDDKTAVSSAATVKLYEDILHRLKNLNVPENASYITKIHKTLAFNKWGIEKKQKIEDKSIKADSVVFIALPVNTSDEIAIAFDDAALVPCAQVDGSITLEITGTVPTKDFDVDICVL